MQQSSKIHETQTVIIEERNSSTITVRDFNIPFSIMDRTLGDDQQGIKDLNTIYHLDLTDI